MHKSQLHFQSLIPFIDYVPAELKETDGSAWRIVFYVKKPGTGGMKRFRRRVKPMSNKLERKRYAKRICTNLNEKLATGWSPFTDDYGKNDYILLTTALERFNKQNKELLKTGQLREASVKSYASMALQLVKYLEHINNKELFCVEFNRAFVTNYADYMFFEKKRTGRTVNNYIRFCNTLANFLTERGYLLTNSISGMPIYKVEKKKRTIIDALSRKRIFTHAHNTSKPWLTICLTIYYCFIRRTELTKLKVKDIRLADGVIVVPADISKNRKTESVTIPSNLAVYLVDHIKNAVQSDYVFSNNHFKPGSQQLAPKKISDTWMKVRKELQLPDTHQFYSLKDTGITELFKLNIPLISIRDQARHHDIKITESYTPRNYKKDILLTSFKNEF